MTVTVVDAGPRQVSRSVEVAAPATELFAIVADPRRHHELDGSGTVVDNIRAPAELTAGSKFSTKMRMLGVPRQFAPTGGTEFLLDHFGLTATGIADAARAVIRDARG